MDKLMLLKQFYSSVRQDMLKLECKDYGFDTLRLFQSECTVEYVELKGSIHKYKLKDILPVRFDYFLKHHILQNGNVCGYFNSEANSVFAFNFDTSKKNKDNTPTDTIKASAYITAEYLRALNIEPLVILSGRGYHIWVRLAEPVYNKEIGFFIKNMKDRINDGLKINDLNFNDICISAYPQLHEKQTHSLRLFGSEHVKNKVFSHICTDGGTLNELDSWLYFEEFIKSKTTPIDVFKKACLLNYAAWEEFCEKEAAG